MTRRFFSGSTLDQAVMMAARHYEIDPEELAYRQIEKRHGFLRTRKAVMIAVDPEQPRRGADAAAADSGPAPVAAAPPEPEVSDPAPVEVAPPAPADPGPEPFAAAAPAPAPPASPVMAADPDPEQMATESWGAPAPEAGEPEEAPAAAESHEPEEASAAVESLEPEEAPAAVESREPEEAPAAVESPTDAPRGADHDDELLGAAEEASQTLMRFAGIEGEASARSSGERVEVEVDGPDTSLLVVESGKGLLAIQHLLPRMLRGLTGRSSFVRVDSQGFHQQRRERLETLALKEAEAASRTGTPRTLPPMAPDERRIVHLALQDAPTVVTESQGTGLHKRVVVRPVSGDGGSDDIEARHGF